MSRPFEHDVVISGVARSAVGRRLGRSSLDLTLDAVLAALADAGLTRADVDGLSTYPGGYADQTHGYGGPPPAAVQDALRLDLSWFVGAAELPGQLGALVSAAMAVSTGLARHVVVYRTVTESSAQGAAGRGSVLPGAEPAASGIGEWSAPFGGVSAVNWLAPVAMRHMHCYGTTREQLGQIALAARRGAALDPGFGVFTAPLGLDDYLAARMISTPLCLLDCDVPVDGSTALVVSPAAYAPDAPHGAVGIEAFGTALHGRPSWDQYADLTSMAAQGASRHLWSRTDLKPSDVDIAQLYDGFSILALVWLEALGFCAQGEGGPFLDGGANIAPDGRLPLNTAGGQLSGGRLHGFGLLHEAVVQLRGQAGSRQIRDAEVAVVANGGGPIAGATLLTRR
ncbi:thiolase C-terminal domain-containing protein [Pseudonocardia sp. GCM10023141]|uniref:thiolase C-terminal domain-containing protein n=1 Tax=Pseudonocardia sp. GCM10023141 TaxID=3252653 RepID=UPI00361A7E24